MTRFRMTSLPRTSRCLQRIHRGPITLLPPCNHHLREPDASLPDPIFFFLLLRAQGCILPLPPTALLPPQTPDPDLPHPAPQQRRPRRADLHPLERGRAEQDALRVHAGHARPGAGQREVREHDLRDGGGGGRWGGGVAGTRRRGERRGEEWQVQEGGSDGREGEGARGCEESGGGGQERDAWEGCWDRGDLHQSWC